MSRSHFLRFLVIAAVLFLVLQRGYVEIRKTHERFLNDTLNGSVSAWLINTISPSRRVTVVDGALSGGGRAVDIKKGCEGFEVMILLVSILAAYPMRWRMKLAGIFLGSLLIYLVNIIRITSLYYITWLYPNQFEFFHITVWQTVIVLLASLFFMFWINRAARAR